MPSKSKKQAKLMRAVAHGWKPSRIKGPTRAVAQEFVDADERRDGMTGYGGGGMAGYGGGGYADEEEYGGGGYAEYGGGGPAEYQFGGGVPPYGAMMGRMPYRGVPPQRGMIGRGATGNPYAMADRMRGRLPGRGGPVGAPRGRLPGPRGPMRPGVGGRGGALSQYAQRMRGPGGLPRGGVMGGKPGPGIIAGEGIPGGGNIPPWKQLPGRRIAPPPGRYPGGGNPMLRGRNPMMRGAQNRLGRGATSFMR